MTRKRRRRGEGGIRSREDKCLWVAEVRAGGKRRTLYGKTKQEVAEKLRRAHNEGAAGLPADVGRLAVGQ